MTLDQATRRSVQNTSSPDIQPMNSLVLSVASIADDVTPWGMSVQVRDAQLRKFWPTEPILASAIFNISGRDAAFSWTLDGPPRTVAAVQRIFHEADFGGGWLNFITKLKVDLLTQDNGAFIEVIRATDSAQSPVVGIAHLDAGRCRRTRDRETPVVYTDDRGVLHAMKWYQVIAWSEFPSPIRQMNGVQYCAVTRCLRAAQLLRDVGIYQREKIGGNTADAVHLIGGVTSASIEDAISNHQSTVAEEGFIRYIKPVLIASLDPTATVTHEEILLKSLPDGFDIDVAMRWYINQLALAFGADYQDFAPLPGRGLGSSNQSLVLHMKSRGKGPELFMKGLEHQFNFHGVIPRNVTFRFDEQDLEEDKGQADLSDIRARTRQVYVQTQVLTIRAVQQQMLDNGEITQEEFDALRMESDVPEGDITEDVTAHDDQRIGERALKQDEDEPSDERPAFMEDERLAREEKIEREISTVLRRHLDAIRGHILPSKMTGIIPGIFASRFAKQGDDPGEVFEDEALWRALREDMVGAMAPNAREAALEAARGVSALGVAVDMEGVNQAVLEFTGNYVDDWWASLEATSRNNLRSAMLTWQESGLGDRGLNDLIKAIEPTFGRDRARRIAVTEVTRLYDLGNNLANVSAGIEQEEWQTARDERVCPVCGPLDKQRFPTSSGPRPVSDSHVNCRCQRLPVGFINDA